MPDLEQAKAIVEDAVGALPKRRGRPPKSLAPVPDGEPVSPEQFCFGVLTAMLQTGHWALADDELGEMMANQLPIAYERYLEIVQRIRSST